MTYTGWLTGQEVDADGLNAMVGTTQTYTPTWTAATTNPTLGNGTLTGEYVVLGQVVHFTVKLTIGSTSTMGTGNYAFSLPPSLTNGSQDWIGNLFIGDSSIGSGGYTAAALAFIGAGASVVQGYAGAPGASSALTQTNPQTFATGDRIWISATYLAA